MKASSYRFLHLCESLNGQIHKRDCEFQNSMDVSDSEVVLFHWYFGD